MFQKTKLNRCLAIAFGSAVMLSAPALAQDATQRVEITAFCSYEWTSMPDNRNLHRNVFFRDCAKVPDYPFSSLDSTLPTELWDWMDGQRKSGNEELDVA